MFTIALALFACGEEEEPDPPAPTVPVFAPTEGEWTIDSSDAVNDPCGLAGPDLSQEGWVFEIAEVTATSFLLDFDVDLMTPCSLTGQDYSCDPMVTRQQVHQSIDADFVVSYTPSGTFSDSDNYDGTQIVEIACEGTECAAVDGFLGVTLPCTIDYEVTASAGG